MAKLIKYQLMTEVKNTYQIPIEEEVEKVVETVVPKEVDGEIIMETVTETVTETVVTGYEEKEEVTQIFSNVAIKCNASNFEANYAIAEKEAYGEITVEDDGEPDPVPADNDEYADMAAAIREGVNGI